jgi:aspartate 1-decarboxylase
MLRQMLKSKIHRATVTEADLHYEGSIGIDTRLMEAAGLLAGERVLVADIDSGARLETYVIEGGPGEIILNGAAARLGAKGDKVIIMGFALVDDAEAAGLEAKIVHVDEKNAIVD